MLNQKDSRQIEQAVSSAEALTSTEITICIRRASGQDRGMAALVGAIVLAAIAGAGTALYPEMNIYALMALALAAGVLMFAIVDWFDLGLRLLPAHLLIKEARRAARAMFLDHGIDTTPQRNAVLLFVSRAERYVEILPDRGLAAAVPAECWADIVMSFQETARQRNVVGAVCDAVAAIGAACAGPFPASADNPDLISNKPITE